MFTENAVLPFDISIEELSVWNKRPHQHTFFELVYVEKGEGMQCINKNMLPYGPGAIFLLPPYDCHSFEIRAKSSFVFIRFKALFFGKNAWNRTDYSDWFTNLHYILSSYNRQPGDILASSTDKMLAVSLIHSIRHEFMQNEDDSEPIIRTNMVALMNLIVRNFERTFRQSHQGGDRQPGDMLHYIQYNLFDNEKLRIDALAERFNLSANYVSEYFKKKTGESLKEYILRARVNVAQSRMQHSGQSIKEIAWELGFTDASHLSKVIKKYDPAQQACTATTW
ncbi:AraC family transcriptional regulator [Dyadobacter sandarakinus]|uniref:AraC family transcriptional regulator n=1 Tax=Dyadobacter sandarakinus TaxID=2747268 RepID=A0ABX7I4U1_9BACT|nr:AraC family transcriptional regulator [Dyadobacter sandarakinus]QRR00562.1 AraC family transcriptional regulator [Dyadobacter sandarakinus]